MNYFEIINKCLVELNYKNVNTFSELVKNDHKKLKDIINIINNEVCSQDNWNFKLRKTSFTLPANTTEAENRIPGRIASLVIDGVVYKYFDKPDVFINGKAPAETYGRFNENLLLPEFDSDKTVNVVYYTSNSVVDVNGNEKMYFEKDTDKSLIPAVFLEPILVYGACMRLKANPKHVKFSYWMSMYNNSLANMRSKIALNADAAPAVIMHRN